MSLANVRISALIPVSVLLAAAVAVLPGAALAHEGHAHNAHADGGPAMPLPADEAEQALDAIAKDKAGAVPADTMEKAIDSPTLDQYHGNSPAVGGGGGDKLTPSPVPAPTPDPVSCTSPDPGAMPGKNDAPKGAPNAGGPEAGAAKADAAKAGGDELPADLPAAPHDAAHGAAALASANAGDCPAAGGGGVDPPADHVGGGRGPAPEAVGGGNGGPEPLAAAPTRAAGGGGALPFTGLGTASVFGMGTALLLFGISMHIRGKRRAAGGDLDL